MKLSVLGLAFASAVMWGLGVLFVGLVNMARPGYGAEFLQMCSSIYPGYKVVPALSNVLTGTCYALVDGFVGGAMLALVYNVVAGMGRRTAPPARKS